MKREEFDKLVEEVKSKNPILFGLEPDQKAEVAEIENVEAYYGIKLPQDYKDFLLKYGQKRVFLIFLNKMIIRVS